MRKRCPVYAEDQQVGYDDRPNKNEAENEQPPAAPEPASVVYKRGAQVHGYCGGAFYSNLKLRDVMIVNTTRL